MICVARLQLRLQLAGDYHHDLCGSATGSQHQGWDDRDGTQHSGGAGVVSLVLADVVYPYPWH